MLKSDVVLYFGSSAEVCRVLKLTSGAVAQWGALIPEKRAMQLERMTAGGLKYQPSLYDKTPKLVTSNSSFCESSALIQRG